MALGKSQFQPDFFIYIQTTQVSSYNLSYSCVSLSSFSIFTITFALAFSCSNAILERRKASPAPMPIPKVANATLALRPPV